MKKNHYKKYYGYYKKNKRDLLICGILALLTLVIVYKMHFIIAIHENRGGYELDYNVALLIWGALTVGHMSYFIMLFMFDEDYYYSGGFKICYSEINHIEVEDEVYTSKALVVVCKLMKDEKVIGYDRMVAQDFICLKAKIDEKTKIVKKL